MEDLCAFDCTVADIEEGRSIIKTFVDALNYYHNIACLTFAPESLDQSIFDIYKALQEQEDINSQMLFDFFLEQFSYDFLFIEGTKELMRTDWFAEFQQYMIDFKLDHSISIVMISYHQSH